MPKFPFTNYHELNLDWILKKVTALFDASEENARTIRTYDSRLTAAEQTATNAETAANAAELLADAAATTAGEALSLAGTADAKADSALTAATDAAGAVSGALTIAQEAQQTAGAAVATANDAAATASSLESLANTANQNATAALESAQTADQKAVAAQQTATTADQKADTNAENIATLQTAVETISGKVSDIDNKADVIIYSTSGSIASFADGANDMPIKSLVVNIEPVQAGSGDPSPANIRPINGWNGVNVTRVGKNLLKKATGGSSNGITCTTNDNGSVAISGTATSSAVNVWFLGGYGTSYQVLRVYAGETVTITDAIAFFHYDGQALQGFGGDNSLDITRSEVFTFAENGWIDGIRCPKATSGTTYSKTIYPQLELGSIATAYEPYKSNQIYVNFPTSVGTVYGGQLDVISGLLTVDRAIKILNGSDNDGTYSNPSVNRFNIDNIGIDYIKGNYLTSSGISNIYPSVYQTAANAEFNESVSTYDYAYNLSSSVGIYAIRIKDTRFTTIEEIKSYFSSNNAQFLIKLRNPQTYQLTPQQINTLLGSNNIYSDAGTVYVQYPADTKLYIDGKIAELQALVLEH